MRSRADVIVERKVQSLFLGDAALVVLAEDFDKGEQPCSCRRHGAIDGFGGFLMGIAQGALLPASLVRWTRLRG
jgi:hypothetical protein